MVTNEDIYNENNPPETREQKIEALLSRIDDWDLDDLIDHVKDNYRQELVIMDDEMLEQEFQDCFGDIEKLSKNVKY